LKISITKKGLVEWLKVKALNSSPSTGKKLIKKKKRKKQRRGPWEQKSARWHYREGRRWGS
jgi:hypothetical protein